MGEGETRVSWQRESRFHPGSTLSPIWKCSSLVQFLDGDGDDVTGVTGERIAVVFNPIRLQRTLSGRNGTGSQPSSGGEKERAREGM